MYSAIILKHSASFTSITFSDEQRFKLSVETGKKIEEQLKPYFGCAYMPDWLGYDIPDEEITKVETDIYQMFGSEMTPN